MDSVISLQFETHPQSIVHDHSVVRSIMGQLVHDLPSWKRLVSRGLQNCHHGRGFIERHTGLCARPGTPPHHMDSQSKSQDKSACRVRWLSDAGPKIQRKSNSKQVIHDSNVRGKGGRRNRAVSCQSNTLLHSQAVRVGLHTPQFHPRAEAQGRQQSAPKSVAGLAPNLGTANVHREGTAARRIDGFHSCQQVPMRETNSRRTWRTDLQDFLHLLPSVKCVVINELVVLCHTNLVQTIQTLSCTPPWKRHSATMIEISRCEMRTCAHARAFLNDDLCHAECAHVKMKQICECGSAW